MLGLTVKQMLATMDSREYAHWIAYEKVHGYLDSRHHFEVMASIHEELQLLAYMFSQANFVKEDEEQGPVGKPIRYPRPYDVPEEKPERDLDFSEEWIAPQEGTCPPDCQCNGGDRRPTTHF